MGIPHKSKLLQVWADQQRYFFQKTQKQDLDKNN
jgi:hypothetical protein